MATTSIGSINSTMAIYTGSQADAQFATAASVPTLSSGTYTPTLVILLNLDAVTAYKCQYLRVGSTVTVSGRIDADPTVAATSTSVRISLPIASDIVGTEECCGVAFASGIAGMGAAITGRAITNEAAMTWISTDITNQPMYFTFTYTIN